MDPLNEKKVNYLIAQAKGNRSGGYPLYNSIRRQLERIDMPSDEHDRAVRRIAKELRI